MNSTINKNLIELNNLIKKQNLSGEVVYKNDHTNMIRAGRSQISLNVTESRELYTITLQNNKKTISSSANNIEEAKNMIGELSENLNLMPDIPFLTPMKPLNGINRINNKFDEKLKNIDSQKMVDIYQKANDIFSKKDGDNHVSGSFSAGSYAYGIINTECSEPLFHNGSDFNGEVVVQLNSHDKKEIQQLFAGEQLSDMEINFNSLERLYNNTVNTPCRKLDEGKYDVIFTAEALAEIISYFTYVSMGEAKEYGYSYISDKNKVGDKLFGDNITISDRPLDHPLCQKPFGKNGYKRENMNIIKNGVLTDVYYSDKMTCDRFDKKLNSSDVDDYNLMLNTGDGPNQFEEMVLSCSTPTILINYVHYLNFVNHSKGEITGSSRFGTFLLDNGKITHNLESVRMLDTFFHLLGNVEWLSKESTNISATHSYGFRNPFTLNLPKFVRIKGVSLS